MDRATRFGSIFFALLGIAAIVLGILEFVVLGTYGLEGHNWGPLGVFPGDFGEGAWWTGIVLICAGALYLSSVSKFAEMRQLAKAVLASIMIWILAGISLWGMITESIPTGAESGPWFNNAADFFTTYAWPYAPEIFLLPFSLVIIYFILRKRATGKELAHSNLTEEGASHGS
jgi:hypothetical protein